jgi:hypothetical protein
VKGQFTAVVHGEFRTSGSLPVKFLAVCAGIAALVSWMATVLVELAIAFGGFAAVLLAVCWLVRRPSDRDMQLMAERAAALQDQAAPQAVAAGPREIHYHLHLPPGADASGVDWAALPPGNPITEED